MLPFLFHLYLSRQKSFGWTDEPFALGSNRVSHRSEHRTIFLVIPPDGCHTIEVCPARSSIGFWGIHAISSSILQNMCSHFVLSAPSCQKSLERTDKPFALQVLNLGRNAPHLSDSAFLISTHYLSVFYQFEPRVQGNS